MKRLSYALMLTLLLILTPGCNPDKERGVNRPDKKQDMPRAAPETEK